MSQAMQTAAPVAARAQHDDGYIGKGTEVSRQSGQVFGVPGEDKILRALAAKLNATRRMGQSRRQGHAHGRRDTW